MKSLPSEKKYILSHNKYFCYLKFYQNSADNARKFFFIFVQIVAILKQKDVLPKRIIARIRTELRRKRTSVWGAAGVPVRGKPTAERKNMELDHQKILDYAQMFNRWKAELFPKEEYAYKNGCCFAFAHLLAQKAREEGRLPLKVWCLPQEGHNLEAVFAADNADGTGKREWEGYHVALALDLPVYKDSVKTERLVFDPIIFNAPVLEKDWKKLLNNGHVHFMASGCRSASDNRKDTSVYGGSGYWLDRDPAMNLDRHARLFVGKVDCSGTHFIPRSSSLFLEAMKQRRNASFSKAAEQAVQRR